MCAALFRGSRGGMIMMIVNMVSMLLPMDQS
jgi:hypothetical protein